MAAEEYYRTEIGQGYEIIKVGLARESFVNKYLEDPETQAFKLDDGSIAYAGDWVIAGINDTFFKDEDSYGQYLIEYFGNGLYRLPYVKEDRYES